MLSLDGVPRLPLGVTSTSLDSAPQLGERLGVPREFFVKRDDLTAPGLGGNKVRKLEYLLGDARKRGCDTVVTVGANQSNHARVTAVSGAMHGFEVHLVLGGGEPTVIEGNLLLDVLTGATIHHVPSEDWRDLDREHRTVTEKLEADGRAVYRVPMGGSTVVGALGYVRAYAEITEQLDQIGIRNATLVHASSTGGTQAGLIAGRVLRSTGGDPGPSVAGVDVAKGPGDLHEEILTLANDILSHLECPTAVPPSDVVLAEARGGAYGEVTQEGVEAIVAGVQAAGIVTDPVYSGKALGAIPRLVDEGVLEDGPIVFLHTGGHPALLTQRYATDVLDEGDPR